MTRPVSVRGGSDGIEAHCEEIVALAHEFGAAGGATAHQTLATHRFLAHPAVLAAAVLDPVGATDFSAELLLALDGPTGLGRRALECAVIDLALRGAAGLYEAADELDRRVQPVLDAFTRINPALLRALPKLADGDPGGALQTFITSDPALAGAGADLLTTFWGGLVALNAVAALPDGRAVVTSAGRDPGDSRGPRDLTDLLAGLARRNKGEGGDIDVRFVVGDDGRRRAIVDIPGTKSWSPMPSANVADLPTNIRAVSGARTTYQAGVIEAMRQAGVTAADEVLLVGHSQGGMVAVNTAAETARTGEYTITHVITAGSPIGRLDVPRSVQVLALENEGDIIPHADGAINDDRTNITTVTLHRNHHEVVDNHSLEDSYIPGAADVEASGDRSVQDYLGGLAPFVSSSAADTYLFHVERR